MLRKSHLVIKMDAVKLTTCILQLISVTMNTLGLYFLHNVRSVISNQRMLLMNLSLAEIFVALLTILYSLMEICRIESGFFYSVIILGLSWYFYLVYLFTPFIIMLDRFIGVMSPLKYPSIFPKRRAGLVIIITWSLGSVLLVPRLWFSKYLEFCPLIALAIELAVLGFIIIAFTIMVLKLRKHRQEFSRSNVQSRVLVVGGLIVGTSVLLVLLPEIINSIAILDTSVSLAEAHDTSRKVYLITCINYIVDPIIYLYGYPPLRHAIKSKISKNT